MVKLGKFQTMVLVAVGNGQRVNKDDKIALALADKRMIVWFPGSARERYGWVLTQQGSDWLNHSKTVTAIHTVHYYVNI